MADPALDKEDPPAGDAPANGDGGGAPATAPAADRTILLAAVVATLVVCLAGAYLLGQNVASLGRRVDALSERLEESKGDKATKALADKVAEAITKRESADPKTLAGLAKQVGQLSDDTYQYYTDTSGDLHELKHGVKQIQSVLKTLGASLAKPGTPNGHWGLVEPGTPPTADTLARYRQEAEAAGVTVADGLVVVRGFLNMSPNRSMPIEYFVTRWPESGHETLVHVIGPTDVKDLTPERLKGLPTALYKGLLAAGFHQGESSRMEPGPEKDKPVWVAPTGDTLYLGLRYTLGGKTHVARATDWVGDPSTGAVLPEDCFRFTGSRPIEDSDTGEIELAAEEGGLIVSVYRTPNTLVEIATASNLSDNYEYNYARIPKPHTIVVGDGALRFEAFQDGVAGTIRLVAMSAANPDAPPDIVVQTGDGPKVIPTVAEGTRSYLATAPELKARWVDWQIRASAGGHAYEGGGFEPLYLDMMFSKRPIVPEGDGAIPVAPIPAPPKEPPGEPPAPAPLPSPPSDGMDGK